MGIPNIFEYATKELSQDAMLCWLVACASEANGKLQECGRAFVKALFKAGDGQVVDPKSGDLAAHSGDGNVTWVDKPKTQYKKLDVYFQATVDNQRASFVIEDKTHSEAHGNQLARYLKIVMKDDKDKDLIKPVFFKTGFIYDDERENAKRNKYAVFSADDMVELLTRNGGSEAHDLLRQYVEHMNGDKKYREGEIAKWQLHHGFVQWEFAKKLRCRLEGRRDDWLRFVPDHLQEKPNGPDWTWNHLGRGSNKGGGGDWTQYRFAKHLFWRLDSWKPLRLMVDTCEASKIDGWDASQWTTWSEAFEHVRSKTGLPRGQAYLRQSKRGGLVAEGTVGALDPGEGLEGRSVDEFTRQVADFTVKFLEATG